MPKASPLRIFVGMLLGVALGYLALVSPLPAVHGLPMVTAPLGTLFINAIRLCVIPLVVSRLIVGCAAAVNPGALGRLAAHSFALMLSFLGLSALFAGSIAFPIFRHLAPAVRASPLPTFSHAVSGGPSSSAAINLVSWVSDLIPANVVKAASDGALLPLIFFSVAFGLAVSRLPADTRKILDHFFTAVGDAFTVLIGAVLQAAPFGVFCLSVSLAGVVGIHGVGALASYIAMLSLVSAGFILLILYPSMWLFGQTSLRSFVQAAAPAQALAFTSRSSLAALPATYTAARQQLGIQKENVDFFFPVAASVFRVGGCMAQVIGVSFLAAFYGVPLAPSQLALIAVSSVAVSFTVPGVPGGAIIVMTPALSSLGIPLEGMAMLLAVDTVPDMFRTAANVTGWLAAGVLLPTSSRDNHHVELRADRESIS